MTHFTGIDVSLRSVSIRVVDEAGEVRYVARVAAEIDGIVAATRRFSAEVRRAGLEAGTLTPYLTYGSDGRLCGGLPGGAPDLRDAGGHACAAAGR